jgi:Domain of unknown function (DUF1707)
MLRASDADRWQVAEALREHTSVGRLTVDELEARLDRALAARTLGELDALVRDLPGGRLPQQPRQIARRGIPVGWLLALGLVLAALYFVPATFWVVLALSIALAAVALVLLPFIAPVVVLVAVAVFVLTRLPYRARRI